MVWCQSLLFLIAFLALSAGKPLERQHLTSTNSNDPASIEDTHPSNTDSLIQRSIGENEKFHKSFLTLVQRPVQNDASTPVGKRKQISKSPEETKKTSGRMRKGGYKGKKSNTELLHHLGMKKIRSPAVNHHRKRLASQSRKTHGQKTGADSKMFVIKLPPNPYYYAGHDLPPRPEGFNNLPVDFSSNGKPSRVYHWNIPVLKKMVARKAGSSGKSVFADSEIFNIDKQVTWNDTDDDKSMYRKATYYAPKKQSKHAFRKYFPGNGKPHSFYVMEKSKKPSFVQRLLP